MASLTLDQFLTSFPEFRPTNPGLLAAKLAEALLSIDQCVWGLKANVGQGYLAAHLVTMSPTGQNARMVVKGVNGEQATTTYWAHYKRLQREVASAGRSSAVAGGLEFRGPMFNPYPFG